MHISKYNTINTYWLSLFDSTMFAVYSDVI